MQKPFVQLHTVLSMDIATRRAAFRLAMGTFITLPEMISLDHEVLLHAGPLIDKEYALSSDVDEKFMTLGLADYVGKDFVCPVDH
jgi:hypothetical protein